MNHNVTFGKWEAAALVMNAICAKIFLDFPRAILAEAGTAGWIQTIIASLAVLLLFWLIARGYKKYENMDLLDIGERMGKDVGRIFTGITITGILFYIASLLLREYTENIKIIAFENSPLFYITIFFIAGMIVGAYSGLEAIVRFHVIAFPFVALTYIGVIIGVSPYFNFTNMFPLLGNGIYSIAGKGLSRISLFAPLLFLFLIPPYIKSHHIFKSAGTIALAGSSLFLITASAAFLAVYPYPLAAEIYLPMHQLARIINYGRFFQRIEAVFILGWILSAFMYLSILLYFVAFLFKKTFKLEYYKPLVFPFAVLIFFASQIPSNLTTTMKLEIRYYSYLVWISTFIIPLLLLTFTRFNKNPDKGDKS